MRKLLVSIAVSMLTFQAAWCADFYVAPTGDDNAAGSREAPFRTLRKAIEVAEPGSNIYMQGGVHKPQESEIMRHGAERVYSVLFSLDKDGAPDKPITITSYPGERAVIDLSEVKPAARVMAFHLTGDHWHLKGFDITGIKVTQTGHSQSINVGIFGGSHNVVEQVNMHDGMGIGVYAVRGSDNLILNCDAYNNYDSVSGGGRGGNCDGFGFHFKDVGYSGNIVRGCRAWRNSDDGFDLINNSSPVVIENCWAWENGYDADLVSRGDGTGFKCGGYGMKPKANAPAEIPRNVVRNCISYGNKNKGIYANHHLGGLDFVNNSSYRDPSSFNMVNRKSAQEAVDVPGYGHMLRSNVALSPRRDGEYCINLNPELSQLVSNSFDGSVTMSDSDFESLDPSQLLLPRKEDGSLPDITFLKLREGTPGFEARIGYQF